MHLHRRTKRYAMGFGEVVTDETELYDVIAAKTRNAQITIVIRSHRSNEVRLISLTDFNKKYRKVK